MVPIERERISSIYFLVIGTYVDEILKYCTQAMVHIQDLSEKEEMMRDLLTRTEEEPVRERFPKQRRH